MHDDTNTYLTDFHRALSTWLEGFGLELQDEVDFPPYRVDIYIPRYHLAVEADGPNHHKKADETRTAALLKDYHLNVLHVTKTQFKNKRELTTRLTNIVVECQRSAIDRYEKVKERVPWI